MAWGTSRRGGFWLRLGGLLQLGEVVWSLPVPQKVSWSQNERIREASEEATHTSRGLEEPTRKGAAMPCGAPAGFIIRGIWYPQGGLERIHTEGPL